MRRLPNEVAAQQQKHSEGPSSGGFSLHACGRQTLHRGHALIIKQVCLQSSEIPANKSEALNEKLKVGGYLMLINTLLPLIRKGRERCRYCERRHTEMNVFQLEGCPLFNGFF